MTVRLSLLNFNPPALNLRMDEKFSDCCQNNDAKVSG